MEITSPSLAYGLTTLTAGLVLALALWWPRKRWQGWRRLLQVTLTSLAIVLCQLLAVVTVFVHVNREFEFYATWDDVLGVTAKAGRITQVPLKHQHAVPITRVPISANNPHPKGRLVSFKAPGAGGPYAPTAVYLPAAYDEPSQANKRFPVIVMVAGVGSPGPKFAKMLDAVEMNSKVIAEGKASPFIAVYVGGSVMPGIDSECVDVQGANHETYLAKEVPAAVRKRFRADHSPERMFISGWSTGGYCAALMMAKHPNVYHAGVAVGGYFHPMFGDPSVALTPTTAKDNSLVEMVRAKRLKQLRLMSLTSVADRQSWGPPDQKTPIGGQLPPDSRLFHEVARRLPGTAFIELQSGGHNFGTYLPHFPTALAWLGNQGL